MSKRLAYFLCYLLLLTQLVNGLPQSREVSGSLEASTEQREIAAIAPTVEHEDISNNNNRNINVRGNEIWSKRNQLLLYALGGFTSLSNFTVERGTDIFRNVLNEAATVSEPTDILLAHLDTFSQYVARVDRIKKLSEPEEWDDLYNMVVLFTNIVEQYNTTMSENATSEDIYLEMLLKNNGLEELQTDFLARFHDFAEAFNTQMDKYLRTLTLVQRANELRMIQWYQTFKDETNLERKVGIFSKFFEFYA